MNQKLCGLDRDKVRRQVSFYSYITTFLFEAEESQGRALPWSTMKFIASDLGFSLDEVEESCQCLFKYRIPQRPIQDKFKFIEFLDYSFSRDRLVKLF